MPNPAHFILVDFQNVTKVDLDRLAVEDVVLLLFLGENQKKLSATLEKQVINHQAEVRLIKVGDSAPNALDKRLVEYLGGLCSRHPGAQFHILSKDKDYDLVVACLVSTGLKVARYDAFEELPIITAKKSGASRAPFAMVQAVAAPEPIVAPPPKLQVVPKPKPVEDKMEKLIKQMKNGAAANRPKKRSTMEHHINAAHGNKLSSGEVAALINRLIAQRVIAIDAKGKVTYPSQ
jgi:hypothetical protein